MDEDEPLEWWAARRDARRRQPGTRKAVLLDGSGATHLNPTAPRLVLEWDGYTWQPVTVADDYAAAQRVVHRIEGDGVMKSPPWSPNTRNIFKDGGGRHRKP